VCTFLSGYNNIQLEKMKIIGMLPVYNDEDVIQEVLEHLISQGLELVVLDNGSTDKTFEICKKFLNHGVLELHQYKASGTYLSQWHTILRMLYDMALRQSPDWIIRSDSDEILESGKKNLTLKEAITQADKEGNNLIQFNRFDFFMTDNDNDNAKSIKEKLCYYSYDGDYLYRTWKYIPGITIGYHGGHLPIFPDEVKYKVCPRKFVLRHYPFRSKEQVEKKKANRKRGINEKNGYATGQITQINKLKKAPSIVDHNLLTKYNEDENWNYELKFCPLLDKEPPKREEVFSEDGYLKSKPKSPWILHQELKDTREQMLTFKIRKLVHSTKKSVNNKIRSLSKDKRK